ncbi:D-2-hydroxyacid dehydrogenase family protein [Mucilaginibacter polytrichastri]|uniref:D-3-phosphoglycerate dehydrogenase n=1 Tax=Mucilaginibacter polytrichastri TaxID=1302689 RepID=A0A1Q5ZYE4_9SPHI|nr:D-2-hydroxyacid dehydrogenase family protein [Mucilaginibacter polytrichastri]OKS86794.1 D-3-phosphoglycerate dehydrogenase [Mucilaginibacter polytrichastri]SFT22704.1 Phosphoglycerate dehydrogenase [Mucilaginibacter polytrichastri]
MENKPQIAVLDDYQHVAFKMADWSTINTKADIAVFDDHIADEGKLIERLHPFAAICVMRERTPLTRSILSQLPNLKLIVSTGSRNASIDTHAVEDFGIILKNTGYFSTGASELTWALLMAFARHIPQENNSFKAGGWQQTVGIDLSGKTIGIVGLGRLGEKMAQYARAFDMNIIAWSQNLTADTAEKAGAKLVTKDELFTEADIITVHLVLSDRSRGIIGKHELGLMKPTAYLINTSRGPLVDEHALIETLQHKKIAGAAIDVFDTEPLPAEHPLRKLDNLLATSHIGYVTENTYKLFYGDTVNFLQEWLDQQ